MKEKTQATSPTKTQARPGQAPAPEASKMGKPPFRPVPGQIKSPATASQTGGLTAGPDGSDGSPDSDGVLIDDEIAGELANMVPTLINLFEPAWETLNDAQMLKIGRALRVYLDKKYDKRELSHPELLLVVASYGYVMAQVKNVKKAMVQRKAAKAHAPDDRRPEGDGENKPGLVDGPKV